MRRLLAFAILVVALGGFLWLQATRPAPQAVEVRERVWRVEAMQVEPAKLRPTLKLYGRVEAPDRMRAAAPVAGRVLDVYVRDGERVAAGQVLARLDPRDLEPRLQQARAELEREIVRVQHDREALEQERRLLELVEARLERATRLQGARAGAESAVDQAREEVIRARLALNQRNQAIAEHPARLELLKARVAEAERDVSRGRIVAPFDARISRVEVAAGDPVQAGQSMLSLYADDALYLRAAVPALYAAELGAAIAAGDVLEAAVRFGTKTFAARLERIAGEGDARGVDALLRLGQGVDVPAGAFVEAVLERPEVQAVLSLPFSALHGGDRIYEVRKDRIAAQRIERVGSHEVGGVPHVLLRVADSDRALEVMTSHLPHAVDGLAVEVVRP